MSVTQSNLLQGKGAWSVILTIDSVQKSDTEKEYVLEAHNVEGSYEYRIVLSTSSEPAGKLFYKSDLRKFTSIEGVTHRALRNTDLVHIENNRSTTNTMIIDSTRMCGVFNSLID